MQLSLAFGLAAAALTVHSTLAIVIPEGQPKIGELWKTLALPDKVSHGPSENTNPGDCSLTVTVVTTKCTGGPYRWGSVFQAYDEKSKSSWTATRSVKGSNGDLYDKTNFYAKCGTNGRFFPTDQVENMDKIDAQGIRFYADKDYAAAWVEDLIPASGNDKGDTQADHETGAPRTVLAKPRFYYFGDSPTSSRGFINPAGPFGYDKSLLVTKITTNKNPTLYLEFCH